ncbi:MAG: NAD(P)/FAD-dependent oxidoreductase [Bacteroidetes bacterium]|nr:NAD(P)/FAD-dependent oxidoreductase [Bacteroidota bacterium]
MAPRPRVVVIGVGFAGLKAVRELRREPVDILLIDRNNFHTFQPLLYQVATSGLQPGDIVQPARHILRGQGNVDFRLATVEGIDFNERLVFVDDGAPIPYDYLILGTGLTTAYFGVEGAEEHGFPLKSTADAIRVRSHILRCFEEANEHTDRVEEGLLTFVIVGGGATGVEMAGALHELFSKVLRKDFPGLDVDRARIVLVEMGDHLMSAYKGRLRTYTLDQLRKRGVELLLEEAVARVESDGVRLKSGENIPAKTLIWAAGVRATSLADNLEVEQTSGGRIVVNDSLQLQGHPEVFVTGDLAGATDEQGQLYPQVAQVAIQQGKHAAKTIIRQRSGLDAESFTYKDLGMMATIGRHAAIFERPSGFSLTGWLAWLGWLFIHIIALIGFRNRLSVLLNWAYNYVTWDRGPRLILEVGAEDGGPAGDRRPRTVDGGLGSKARCC